MGGGAGERRGLGVWSSEEEREGVVDPCVSRVQVEVAREAFSSSSSWSVSDASWR